MPESQVKAGRAALVILFSGTGIHQFPMASNAQRQEEIRQRIYPVCVPSRTPPPRAAKAGRRARLCNKARMMVFGVYRPTRRRTPSLWCGFCLFTPQQTYLSGCQPRLAAARSRPFRLRSFMNACPSRMGHPPDLPFRTLWLADSTSGLRAHHERGASCFQ